MPFTEDERSAGWAVYYDKHDVRPPRPFLVQFLQGPGRGAAGRHAVDLGCGQGTETVALLEDGWHVLAVDREPAAIARVRARVTAYAGRFEAQQAALEDIVLPATDLVHAAYSLPFCHPAAFPALWARIRAALRPGGFFMGQLFGPRDGWAGNPAMTFHTRAAVEALLGGLDVLTLDEFEHDGPDATGKPKHWHLFDIVARQPARSPADDLNQETNA